MARPSNRLNRVVDKLITDRQVRFWTVVSGVAALVAVILAVALPLSSDDQGVAPPPTSIPAPSTSQPVPSSQATSATSSPPSATQMPSPSPEATEEEPIRHRGTVTLIEGGSSIHLDAPPSDPQWEETDDEGYGGVNLEEGGDLYIFGGEMAKLDSAATYGKCSSATGWGGQDHNSEFRIAVTRLKGKECFRWSKGNETERFARIVLKKATDSGAKLDITVWESE